jgi:hypothetical protein
VGVHLSPDPESRGEGGPTPTIEQAPPHQKDPLECQQTGLLPPSWGTGSSLTFLKDFHVVLLQAEAEFSEVVLKHAPWIIREVVGSEQPLPTGGNGPAGVSGPPTGPRATAWSSPWGHGPGCPVWRPRQSDR